MTKTKLHELMLSCKKGCRVGMFSFASENTVSLVWYYDNNHHQETVNKEAVEDGGKELFDALERATEAMKD